jgi:hypothetical protein
MLKAFPASAANSPVYRDLWRGVAEKTRHDGAEIGWVAAKLLRKCRIDHRSARICLQAVSLRQKPFAIGSVDSEDRPTVAR